MCWHLFTETFGQLTMSNLTSLLTLFVIGLCIGLSACSGSAEFPGAEQYFTDEPAAPEPMVEPTPGPMVMPAPEPVPAPMVEPTPAPMPGPVMNPAPEPVPTPPPMPMPTVQRMPEPMMGDSPLDFEAFKVSIWPLMAGTCSGGPGVCHGNPSSSFTNFELLRDPVGDEDQIQNFTAIEIRVQAKFDNPANSLLLTRGRDRHGAFLDDMQYCDIYNWIAAAGPGAGPCTPP